MADAGKDGMSEHKRMQAIVDGMGSPTRILIASIRDEKSMGDLMAYGMDTFTFSPDIVRDLFSEELTILPLKISRLQQNGVQNK